MMKKTTLILMILFLAVLSGAQADPKVTFKEVTEQAGLDMADDLGVHGVATGDLNGDGFIDMVVAHTFAPNYIYLNQGNKTFQKTELESDNYMTHQVLLVDIDNDGDLDLVTSSSHIDYRNKLFLNDGYGNFSYRGSALDNRDGKSRGITASDFDLNGDLDLYAVNFFLPNFLYINEGGVLYERASYWNCTDFSASKSGSQGVVSADVNQDGWPDIYIAKQQQSTSADQPNILYINQGGRFLDRAAAYGIDHPNNNGVTLSDLDNDGDLDVLLANQHHNNNIIVYQNMGGYFLEMTQQLKIRGNAVGLFSVVTGDVNNDGWKDIFMVGYYGICRLILNHGNWSFQKLEDTGVEVYRASGRSASFFDYDNDGDLDLVTTAYPRTTLLFENTTARDNGYLFLTFYNRRDQHSPYGTKVSLYPNACAAGTPDQFRELISTQAYLSQPSTRMHFGLGGATAVSLRIDHPGGGTDYVFDLPADSYQTLGKIPSIGITEVRRTTDDSWLKSFLVDYFQIELPRDPGVDKIYVYRKPLDQPNSRYRLVREISGYRQGIAVEVEEEIPYEYALFYTTENLQRSYVTFVKSGW